MDRVIHQGQTHVSPEEVGYAPEAVANMDALFQRLIAQEKIQAGSYLIARHGKVLACKSMGALSGLADKGDLKPDSLRRIASIGKIFTAIAALQLVEQGVIYLSQPVKDWIPEFNTTKHSGITIMHLLTHTSGLPADPGFFSEPYPRSFDSYKTGENWIKTILTGPLQSLPGERWSYSSFAFWILGEIITRASDQPFHRFVTENVINKLGLKRTFYRVPEALRDEVCVVNQSDLDGSLRTGEPEVSAMLASGAIFSCLHDLWVVGQAMLNMGEFNGQRILGRKTVEAMTQNHLDNVPAYAWGVNIKAYEMGLGWRVTSRNIFSSPGTFGHEGAGRCALYIDPVESLVVAYFVPAPDGWVPESILNPFGIVWSGIR